MEAVPISEAQAGDTVKIKACVTACVVYDIPSLSLTSTNLGKQAGFMHLGDIEVDFVMPDSWNPHAAAVKAVQDKIEEVTEEFQKNLGVLKERLNNLQCLGMSPSQPYTAPKGTDFDDIPF